MQSFLDAALDAIISIDQNGLIIEFNASAERTFGYKREEVLNKNMAELIIPEKYREGHRRGMQAYIGGRAPQVMNKRLELSALRRDGSEIPIELTVTESQRSPFIFTSFIRDITDRKQAEAVLQMSQKQLEGLIEKRTQDLVKSEERFRLMVSAVKDYAILMLDSEGRIVTWNEGARNLKGYESTEIIGRHYEIFYPEIDRQNKKPEAELKEATRLGRFEDEGWRIRKDGTLFWANVIITAVRNERGELIGFSKVTRDLSMRKKLEDSLRMMGYELSRQVQQKTAELSQSRDQLVGILKGIKDGITVLDEDGKFVFANEAGAQMCGFDSVQELLGADPAELMKSFQILDEQGNHFPLEKLPGRMALAGVQDPPEVMVRVRYLKTNQERWSIIKANPIYDEKKKVRMAVSIFKDFTERKNSEDNIKFLDEASRLLSSDLNFEKTIQRIADLAVPKIADWCSVDVLEAGKSIPKRFAVKHVDPKKIAFADHYAQKYPMDWGGKQGAANVMRTGISELYPIIPEEALKAGSQNEEHFDLIKSLGIKSGMVVPLASRNKTFGIISLFSAESGRIFTNADLAFAEELARRAGMAIDNAILFSEIEGERSKNKDALVKMEKLAQMAASASEAKSLFLANMSHEIRTPLGAVLGFTEFLNDLSLSADERLKYTNIIHRNGQLLTQLIDDILDLSKVEAGHLEVETIETSLPNLIADIKSLMSTRAQEKGLNFLIETSGQFPEVIYSDPTRLRQILINVIGNAIKFTEKGFVKLSLATKPVDSVRSEQIIFTVEDTGPGISGENRERLFEWFTQADSSTTRKFGGTGLGLALSRRLARSMHGDVELMQSSAKGSKFIISITTNIDSQEQLSVPSEKYQSELTNSELKPGVENILKKINGLKILLVDDSPDNRFLIKSILERKGMIVELAENGQEGLEKALGGAFNLVLMDMQMPVLDGFAATTQLRSKGYLGGIVALTAHAMKEERVKTKMAGCDAHLTKPIEVPKLLRCIAEFAN